MAVYAVLRLFCFAGAVCYALPSDKKGLHTPLPTRETLPYVAAELRATSYEESDEESDLLPAASRRRVQRKLVTGTEEIDGNQEYQEYQGVMGRPGVDFPILPSIPITSFNCRKVKSSGYYADLETNCQVFHICDGGRKISFLCPNGTIFRQSHLICDWWFRVDCDRSVELYEESAEQLAADQKIYKERAQALTKAMQRGSNRSRTNNQQQFDKKNGDHTFGSSNNSQNRRHNNRKHANNRYTTLNSDNSHNSNNNNNQFVSIKQEPMHNQQQTHNNNNNHFVTTFRSQQSQQRQPEVSGNGGQQNYNTESLEYQNFQQNIAPTYNEDFLNSNRQSNSQNIQNQKKYESYKHENNNQQSNEQTSAKNNFQSVEQERQLPAETASFASNRNNNFGNHYIQHSYFKTSTSKAYKLPIQNELNRNILPTTSSTTETQFQVSTEQPLYSSTTIHNQVPIFNSEFKPDKLLSYVELQKSSSPLQGSSTLSKPHFSPQVTKSTTPTNLNANDPQRNLGYSQAVPTDTILFSYPTLSSLNSYSSEDDNDTSLMQNTPIYPSFNNESSFPLVTKTHAIPSSEHFATNNHPPLSTVIPEYSYTTPTESAGYYYQNNPNAPLPNSNNVQVTYPAPKVTSFPPSFPPSYLLEVSTTLLPPNYSSYTAFNNESSNSVNQLIPQYNVTLAESSQHGNRLGLKVPISSGPKALHSLALYYATSESDLTTGTTSLPPTKSSKLSISEILLTSHSTSAETVTETNILPSTDDTSLSLKDISSVLTKATKDSYRYLFNETNETEDNIGNRNAEVKLKSLSFNDLDSNQSSVIVQQSTTKATMLKINETNYFPDDQKLKESTDLRELAQVFSRALSAYLEDPESFRKVLSEVRPTEPGKNTHTQTLTQESEEEVLDYSDTGVRGMSPTTPTICDDGEGMQVIDIDEINNLVHSVKQNLTSDNYEVPHINENKDRLQTEEFFTTGNPTSLADVNYFFSNGSNFISDINGLNVNDSYFPTAGSVHDESRPRYGGFHNNSESEFATNYAPYGIEISENRTGKPIHETFPTEINTEFVTSTERRYIHSETITESVLPVTQTSIRLESIADSLNAGDAQDVNSLISSNNYSPKPAIGHYITSSDIFMKSTRAQPTKESSTSLPYKFNTADDQEKVLIASSSQSLASRDNYVRFFIRKQNYGSKYQNYNTTVNNSKTAKVAENSEIKNSHIKKNSNILEPPMQFSDSGNTYSNQNFVKQPIKDKAKDAETVKKPEPEILNIQFKTVQHIQPLDLSSKTIHELSNIKHHNHNYHNSETVTNDPQTVITNLSTKPQHFTYQSIDLGNGVTIEHRRTIPYSRRNSWLLSEVLDKGTKINSFSLSNLLTSVNNGHKQRETTEYSAPTNTIQPTTYHPSNLNDDFDIAESIPPRGHQLRTWQWDVQKTNATRIPEMTGGQDHNVYYQRVVSKDSEPLTTPYTESLNSATAPTIYATDTDIETVPTAHTEQIYPEIVPTAYAELLRPEVIPTVYDELLRPETFSKIKPVSVPHAYIRSPSDTLHESYGEFLNSGSRSTLYDTINSSSTIKQDQLKSENISTMYNTQHAPTVRNSSLSAYSKQVPIHSIPALQNSSAAFTEYLSSTTSREHLMLPTTNLKTIINNNDTLETEANEMFGSLNETSKNILMDMMNQAESNVTIRKLVLLLVSDQSGRENKTAEESRSQLIQALLQKPDNQNRPTQFLEESSTLVNPKNILKLQKKEKTKNSSNTQMANYAVTPVFTSKSSEHQSTGAKRYRGTDTSTEIRTNIQLPYGTLHSSEETQNPKISTLRAQTSDFSSESDSRAVELLKSLYNLAAKWG